LPKLRKRKMTTIMTEVEEAAEEAEEEEVEEEVVEEEEDPTILSLRIQKEWTSATTLANRIN
jgi:hypothetical protein